MISSSYSALEYREGMRRVFILISAQQLYYKRLNWILLRSQIKSRLLNQTLVTVVDVRFGKRDCDDHLFIRIGDEWQGDENIALIIGHVS